MILVIEGNIGAGKSVFAEHLCDFLISLNYKVVHIKEPVDLWRNLDGENFLNKYYEDKKRWAFTFQVNALTTMSMNELRAIEYSNQGHVVVMERSTFSVLEIFSTYLSETVFERIETSVISGLKEMFKNLMMDLKKCTNTVLVIYMRTDPEICYERMLNRNRKEEMGNVSRTFIEDLHRVHEEKLVRENVYGHLLIIDGTTFDMTNSATTKAKWLRDEVMEALGRHLHSSTSFTIEEGEHNEDNVKNTTVADS